MPHPAPPQHSHPRKTPKQARALATVEAVVEAAALILEADGLAGFSTNAVAERAGVSIGSLYQYFPEKDALLWALIAQETAMLLQEADEAAAAPSGEAALATLIRATVAHQLRRPALARLLDFEEARLPLDADTQRVTGRLFVLVSGALAHADLPPQPDPGTAARDVLAIIKGIVDTAGVHGDTDGQQLAGRVRRAVLGYLHAAP